MKLDSTNIFVLIMFAVITAVLIFMAFSPRLREPLKASGPEPEFEL